ncbi:hypothetical protein pqer_cds_382 [Pandoravirus quercus]|uniref:Uncharacterized protein n=1 Tax=Pandoravirus quercus TaxID=2107709 RepID=A0A2U7U8P3_9VIRU|nr:hypothetical protein pqer_cds_382 [Pandoravirus quercus]AVK74804.1 hypothetical protein pqer_cds_382 [Pandoravirus quercus]
MEEALQDEGDNDDLDGLVDYERVDIDVAGETAALEALCEAARQGSLTRDQEARLARFRAGDAIGGVPLATTDPAGGSDTDAEMIDRYEHMWKGLARSFTCAFVLSARLSEWPPTPVDIEDAYRDMDHPQPDVPDLFVSYLVGQARAGYHYCVGRLLVDALVCALERTLIDHVSARWPGFADPFAGRAVPRTTDGHGDGDKPSTVVADHFMVAAARQDTTEVVLITVTEDGAARAVAGASLVDGTPRDEIAVSVPVDVTGLCGGVCAYARFLPFFLGAIAAHFQYESQPAARPAVGPDTNGVFNLVYALQEMPSLFDVPHNVVRVLDDLDAAPQVWWEAKVLCAWIEPGQLALALSLAAGAQAVAAVDFSLPPSLADIAAVAYAGPLDAPGLCAEAAARVAVQIWRRVCASKADDEGRLPGAARLVEAAAALDVVPNASERLVPELLCGRLIEPVISVMGRARGLGPLARPPDARTDALDVAAVEAMGRASRLAADVDPGLGGVMAGAVEKLGGRLDAAKDLGTGHRLAQALTQTLWPSADHDERAAWARLYAADPDSAPAPDDIALLSGLASRMGIEVNGHHRATAGALCGLLALAVHLPS